MYTCIPVYTHCTVYTGLDADTIPRAYHVTPVRGSIQEGAALQQSLITEWKLPAAGFTQYCAVIFGETVSPY